ncbi:aminotransferase class I/II-fold pyridoxal phosphate-dependent enzyme [Syntrophomonas erecta subsp. sporosyntropha]
MNIQDHNRTPIFEAVQKYIDQGTISFHVPGHKGGRGIPQLQDYLGSRVLQMDLNGMHDLDYINNPRGVIAEAEKLFAEAYNADYAHFLVNGTTSGVQAMIMSTLNPGDKIIIPRNAHRSTFGGLILSDAVPIYVYPEINRNLGIATGVSLQTMIETMVKHPAARAVFVINPTYYGFTTDLRSIVEEAHQREMVVLVDEAHGAHLPFHKDFPLSAMESGADLSASSIHKTAGSLTQSSVLLGREKLIYRDQVKQVLNLTYTSSASYLLLGSLDVARRQMVLQGNFLLERMLNLVRQVRQELAGIYEIYPFGPELVGTPGCYDFDESKLGIHISGLGYTGYQLEMILRRDYNIQIELADLYNILAIVSIADRGEDLEILVNALKKLSAQTTARKSTVNYNFPDCPEMIVPPREAFYRPKKIVPLHHASGEIAGEAIMAYPPGIPVICMGELITSEIVEHIRILKMEECHLQGTVDPGVNYIQVLK